MPAKTPSCKKEAVCKHVPEAPSCPEGQGSLKLTVSKWKSVLWSDKSKFDILIGNHGCCVFRNKEKGDLPACYDLTASMMVRGCIVHTVWAACMFWKALWMLKGVYKGFRATYALLQADIYFREGLVYFSRTINTTYCSYYNSMTS